MKVVAYLSCLPPSNKNVEKGQILTRFARGVQVAGDEAVLHTGTNIIDCDVALSVGWVHENSKTTPHLMLRRHIVEHQLRTNNKVLLADSSLFLYKDNTNPHHYLRYSFNGVFPTTGIYCDNTPDPARWSKVSNMLGISVKDYRTNGNHILLCLQRNGGWSMNGFDVVDWTVSIINQLRQHTDREIVIRAHPGDKGAADYLSPAKLMKRLGPQVNVRLSVPGMSLIDDLRDCWAVVNHNSSPTVGAAIEGYPVFVTDPARSQCQEIANTALSDIENPVLFERQNWVNRLAMFHWNFNEIANGECWNHMRKFI